MPASATQMTLSHFQSRVLPLLKRQHRQPTDLAAACKSFLTEIDLLDDEGQPITLDIEALSDAGFDTESDVDSNANNPGHLDEAVVKRLIREALDTPASRSSGSRSAHTAHPYGRPRDADASRGFATFGQFAIAVQKAATPGGSTDARLITKGPATFANESAGDAGGYLVPQDWADRIWRIVLGDDSLLARTNQIPTSRNSLSLPVSETTAWGASGVQAYWQGEGAAITPSRPSVQLRNLRLHKLSALVPASDELMEDAAALDAFIADEAARAIRYKAEDAILNGDGVGKPLGLLNAGALVTVDEEGSQSADTVVAENIAKMYARMPASSLAGAVWLINQDVLPQVLTMTLGDQPIYLPPNGVAPAPFGTLLGRPIVLTPHCQTVGDVGDVLFVDLRQYLTLIKRGGLQTASSIHLWFDQDLTAFRFTFRIAGQPWMNAPITPDHGGNTLSPFVALAPRTGG